MTVAVAAAVEATAYAPPGHPEGYVVCTFQKATPMGPEPKNNVRRLGYHATRAILGFWFDKQGDDVTWFRPRG